MRNLVVALALLFVSALPAIAQPLEPVDDTAVEQLTAVPRELRAGNDVTVTGRGCAPGNRVRFELYNPERAASADGVAEGDGTFVQSINLSPSTKVGRNWLRATCLTEESEEKVMEAVLLVSRPEFVVTWTNLIFGLGSALITAGIGLAMLRQPGHSRRSSAKRPGGRKRKKRSRKIAPSTSMSRGSGDGVSIPTRSGPESNGTKKQIVER